MDKSAAESSQNLGPWLRSSTQGLAGMFFLSQDSVVGWRGKQR